MTCRVPSSSTTCAGGSPTGQQLTWDAEGRLSSWQNAPTSPSVTATYLYDGEGNRVVQQVADSPTGSPGTTTTTSYIGRLETVTSDGTTTTTTDYAAAGSVLAESVNGTLSYLVTTYQGSVVEALDGSGVVGVTASQLYAPYGGVRYASGTMPTDYGYTGQRADASTGLDYYGARYYDPTLGQFTSADTVLAGGLNRYGYVGGNPTTATDPSGHMDKPSASDPYLQGMFNILWKDSALWGDKSSMWALMVLEAVDGRPVGGSWHYEKVLAAKNGLEGWVQRTCNSPEYLIACRTGTSSAIDADLVTVRLVLDYIYRALRAWESSDYHTGTPGQNPITSAPSLPAPSPGMPVPSALPAPGGIPAQPGNLAPVPGLEPTQQVPQGAWQSENRPVGPLPNVPGIARLEALNTNATRSGLEPFQHRLVSLNDTGPVDPSYVPWQPSTWRPEISPGVGLPLAVGAAAVYSNYGGYFPPVGGYGGAAGEHL